MKLEDIKAKVQQLATKIDASAHLFPTYGHSEDGARPHIEVGYLGLLHYVAIERGEEILHKTTRDIEQLLYWIFDGVTFSMACDFTAKNRVITQDFRRGMFEKQEELLGLVNSSWQEKKHNEHLSILKNNPFDDMASLRATYMGQLRQQGYPETEIIELVDQKYPRN